MTTHRDEKDAPVDVSTLEDSLLAGENALRLTTSHPSGGVLRPVIGLPEVREVWADYLKLEDILLNDKDFLYFVAWQVGQKEQRVVCASLQAAEASQKKTRGRIERTKKKSAYRKMAVFFGLTIPQRDGTPDVEFHEMSAGVVKVERGDGYIGTLYMKKPPSFDVVRAEFAITVTAPNGRAIVGHGACSANERGFTHPDHDVISTAWTRSLNRAISDMIGMGEVSAEELVDDGVAGRVSVSQPARSTTRPRPARPRIIPTESSVSPAASVKTKPTDAKVVKVKARPDSEPRNLGEFLASTISGLDLTVPKVIEILGIEDLGQIEDWSAALEKVRVAKGKTTTDSEVGK